MNDFTKEELQIIYDNSNPCVTEEMRPILDKLKSMIDNYCDHEWENPCCGCEYAGRIYCDKCKRLLNDNREVAL